MCIVEPKKDWDSLSGLKDPMDWGRDVVNYPESGAGSILEILERLDAISNFLENHERNVSSYFDDGSNQGKSPFQSLPVEVAEFRRLLEAAFRSSRTIT